MQQFPQRIENAKGTDTYYTYYPALLSTTRGQNMFCVFQIKLNFSEHANLKQTKSIFLSNFITFKMY